MRKRRVIIYDDSADVTNILKQHFVLRGYEALTYHEPRPCPVYEESAVCSEWHPCGDILLVNSNMLRMGGIELLREQTLNGCKLPARSKALMTSDLEEASATAVREMGCMYFQKPFSFREIAAWLDEREKLMDLSQPLGMRRKVRRAECSEEIECLMPAIGPVKGRVLNKGAAGLCVELPCPVREGQVLAVRYGSPPLPRTASVQWIMDARDGSCIAGLQFV